MIPISDEWLNSRLTSGSKRRLRQFRASLSRNLDRRNYDAELANLFEEYLRPCWSREYFRTKHYLRDLKSSKDGKFFSQGVKDYHQMEEAIARFQESNHPSFQWNRNYQRAKRELIEEYSKYHLKMVVYDDDESIIDQLPKLNTHSGFTYLETGERRKGDNLGNIHQRYVMEEKLAIEKGSFNKPILPGCRTQASGAFGDNGEFTGDCKHKTRLVSMIDLMVIIAELRFAAPLQKVMASRRDYAGGKDPKAISTIIANYRIQYGRFLSLDYSAFDQSISDWLIYDAFEILRAAFDDPDDDLLRVIVSDFIHKNFVMADGVYYAHKGVPSGSMFTQIIDSIVNVLMVRTYIHAMNIKGDMIVMGDDNLMYLSEDVSVEHIASYITKNFGVKVNAEKTSFGSSANDPEFLSRVWTNVGQRREPHVVISKLLYPERFRDYRNVAVDPAMVLFAYCLTYPITMWQVMDTDRFYEDYPHLKRSVVEELVDSRYLPGLSMHLQQD